jgi:hypothetical protein
MTLAPPRPARIWPFPKWHPLIAGALVGIVLRLIFWDHPEKIMSAMSMAFINFAPFAVAAVTVYMAERIERRSCGYYVMVSIGANMMFVLGTMIIMVEGVICAIIVLPMFALYGAVGGLIMGAICRLTKWPKPAVYSFAALPLLLAAVLPSGAGEAHIGVAQHSVMVQATPEQVWRQLHNTTAISPAEVEQAWLYRIGVPVPISGVTHAVGTTLERDITMGKSIHFTQVASEWQTNRYVKWQYRFAPDSIPPTALDEHVQIGGAYFDLVDTVYTLTPKGNATELTISMQYRVSTQFNWYATRVAALLFANFEEVILDFYARRAEQAQAA